MTTDHNCGKCYECLDKPELGFMNPVVTRMILCETCGNKRCPHATNHNNKCTNSNALNQDGSHYSNTYIDKSEVLMALATDNKIHWFVGSRTNCGKDVKYVSAGVEDDLVCKDCRKAVIKWAEQTPNKITN